MRSSGDTIRPTSPIAGIMLSPIEGDITGTELERDFTVWRKAGILLPTAARLVECTLDITQEGLGLDLISVETFARRLGMSRPSYYRKGYQNRGPIAFMAFEHEMQGLDEHVGEIAVTSPRDALMELNGLCLEFCLLYPGISRVMYDHIARQASLGQPKAEIAPLVHNAYANILATQGLDSDWRSHSNATDTWCSFQTTISHAVMKNIDCDRDINQDFLELRLMTETALADLRAA